jgi:hypothetical protein
MLYLQIGTVGDLIKETVGPPQVFEIVTKSAPLPLLALIHPSAWKVNSQKFIHENLHSPGFLNN